MLHNYTGERPDMLLDWRTVQNKMRWDVVLVAGWGFRISKINRGNRIFHDKHSIYIHVNVAEIVVI